VKIWCSKLDNEMGAPATAVQGLEEKGTEKLKQFAKIVQVNRNSKYGRYKSGGLCSYISVLSAGELGSTSS
jgi:hypothetical protein